MITGFITTGRNLHQVQDTVAVFRVCTNSMGVVNYSEKTLNKVIEHPSKPIDEISKAGEHTAKENCVY